MICSTNTSWLSQVRGESLRVGRREVHAALDPRGEAAARGGAQPRHCRYALVELVEDHDHAVVEVPSGRRRGWALLASDHAAQPGATLPSPPDQADVTANIGCACVRGHLRTSREPPPADLRISRGLIARPRSGIIPVLASLERYWMMTGMTFVATRQASELTGLSTSKLREWTSRRALIPADVPPRSKGSPAKYTWQTILLLRLAVIFRDRFHLELHAHRHVFASLRQELQTTSFVALWGKSLALHDSRRWSLLDPREAGVPEGDALLINLEHHLRALSNSFALPSPSINSGQLDLFLAAAVTGKATREHHAQLPVPRSISETSLAEKIRMKSSTFDRVLQATGFLRPSGGPVPGLTLSDDEDAAKMQAVFRNDRVGLNADAVFSAHSVPTSIFKDAGEAPPRQEEIRTWHEAAWNIGVAPLLWIITPTDVRLYNCYCIARSASASGKYRAATSRPLSA